MSKTIRILDADKFVYILETCRYYGIKFEEVDDNISTSSESSISEAPGAGTLKLQRTKRVPQADISLCQ